MKEKATQFVQTEVIKEKEKHWFVAYKRRRGRKKDILFRREVTKEIANIFFRTEVVKEISYFV
jgi:hypothetical protein